MKKTLLSLLLIAGMSHNALADNWMKHLPDETYVAVLSIPGSHDTATGEGFEESSDGALGESFARTQDLSIGDQWKLGVRAFDFRPATREGYLHCNHGIVATKAHFDEVLYQLRDSLIANPTEFAIIHLLHASNGDKVENAYNSMIQQLLKDEQIKDYLADFRTDLTVGDMRGKILILSRDKYASKPVGGFLSNWCGYIDWNVQTQGLITGASLSTYAKGRLYMQDLSDTHKEGELDNKIAAINKMLDFSTTHATKTKGQIVWVYNFASAYSKTIFSASTSDGYRDNATYTHTAIIKYLNSHVAGPTGIILMDYAGVDQSGEYQTRGKELVDLLIANNFKYLTYETDEMKVNKTVYAQLTKEIRSLNSKVTAAKTQISTECPDVASEFEEKLSDITDSISKIKAEVEQLYADILLTEESTIDSDAIIEAINNVVAEAQEVQNAFITGILSVKNDLKTRKYKVYSISGTRLKEPQQGAVNIIRFDDGTVVKVKM
ncbi:MAG: hypothetical protein NC206_04270 [Bacteroides sp.]|nr:hypothetical protein [Roseburia sp.]MCM1346279.1 hypothetical protein [Bacteroides sp.]MCM1420866.1 hypothetical protein [Bacteroides sp.]